MQKIVTQEECNERVKRQLVKIGMVREDFCEITAQALPKYKRINFLVSTYSIRDYQFYSRMYELDSNYYFSLLQNSFVEEGLPVKTYHYKITSPNTFYACLEVVKSYAYQKER